MRRLFPAVTATPDEVAAPMPGDGLVTPRDVVMDRAFTLDAPPERVWPWIVQLGKKRCGWYFSESIERFLPRSRRAARTVDARWQGLAVGDVIPDYGGRREYFQVAVIEAPHTLVYTSRRGRVSVSWSIGLSPAGRGTRVHLRLALGPVRRRWLANSAGDLIDAATIAGLAGGLRERV